MPTVFTLEGAQLGEPLGAVSMADITTVLNTLSSRGAEYLQIAVNVLQDPALPTVAGLVQQLRATTAAAPAAAGAAAPAGIGLDKAVKPLEMFLDYRRHPGKYYAIAGAGVLVLGLIGFGIGRATKRSKCPAL